MRVFGTCGRDKEGMDSFSQETKGRDEVEDLGLDGRIILK
jgi:hypothetical protein